MTSEQMTGVVYEALREYSMVMGWRSRPPYIDAPSHIRVKMLASTEYIVKNPDACGKDVAKFEGNRYGVGKDEDRIYDIFVAVVRALT